MGKQRAAALALAILLVLSPAFAAFTEFVTVQVLDSALRPIEGAYVYPIYQLSAQDGFVNGKPKTTNASGFVNISFYNKQFNLEDSDYNYTLVAYFGKQEARTATAYNASRPEIIQLQLASHYITFFIKDQHGSPLLANISVNGRNYSTGGSGTVNVHMPDGTFDYVVQRNAVSVNGKLTVTADSLQEVTIPQYTLLLSVVDEDGTGLNASVMMGGREYFTNSAGKLMIEEVPQSQMSIDVEHDGRRKTVNADLSGQNELEVVFDKKPPEIKEVNVKVVDGAGRVSAYIVDPGKKSSGVGRGNIKVTYTVGSTQGDAEIVQAGYNVYEADIPAQPPNSVVTYTITATDQSGNVASGQGSYVVPAKSPSQAGKPDIPVAPAAADDQTTMIIIGATIGLLVAGVAFYLKKRMDVGKKKPPEEGETSGVYPPPQMKI